MLSKEVAEKIAEELNYENDLVKAIVQDYETKEILMCAFMNREAIVRTLTSGYLWFWSRGKKRLWKKGETSGNIQKVRGVYVDCDKDVLLFRVDAKPACHEGYKTCFFRKLKNGKFRVVEEKVFEPSKVYGE
jgi:phosphoribosyl-AMP cyclohydrolase